MFHLYTDGGSCPTGVIVLGGWMSGGWMSGAGLLNYYFVPITITITIA